MPLPFPDTPRVIYRKNPLEQVVCQIRFPSILKIDTQIPAEFQDMIRDEYPMFSETRELAPEFPMPPEILSQLPQEIADSIPIPATNRMNYKFSTSDDKWVVNLTNNFLALTCFEYIQWESFRQHLELPLNILMEIYRPALFSRIGLRYVNVIRRSQLGLEDIEWSNLIQPYIAGVLSVFDKNSVRGSLSNEEILLSDDAGVVRIIHGLATAKRNNEMVYLIDNDFFFEGNMEITHATERLGYFNNWGRRLFRWAITDRLHESMAPETD